MSSNRVAYLDLAKGFAILMLILSHTQPGETLNTWIFGFHMPIFFMVGGMLLAMKAEPEQMTTSRITALLKRRMHNLILPYLIFCLILTFFYGCMSAFAGSGFAVHDNVFRTFTFQGIDSLWFIPCYFWAELIAALLMLTRQEAVLPILSIALLPCLIIMSIHPSCDGTSLMGYLMKVAVSLSFFVSGIFIFKKHIISKLPMWGSIVLIIIGSIITMWSGFSAIGSLEFPHGSIYYLSAILMSIGILSFFDKIKLSRPVERVLATFGQFSIVILCTNNLLIEICRLLDFKLTGNFMLNHGLMGSLLFFVLLSVLEYGVIVLFKGPRGIIFGKK